MAGTLFLSRHHPLDRDGQGAAGYRKHLGIYAYRKAALERFAALPPSWIEQVERLEQLRCWRTASTSMWLRPPRDTIGVDTGDDLARAEADAERNEWRRSADGLRFIVPQFFDAF